MVSCRKLLARDMMLLSRLTGGILKVIFGLLYRCMALKNQGRVGFGNSMLCRRIVAKLQKGTKFVAGGGDVNCSKENPHQADPLYATRPVPCSFINPGYSAIQQACPHDHKHDHSHTIHCQFPTNRTQNSPDFRGVGIWTFWCQTWNLSTTLAPSESKDKVKQINKKKQPKYS